MTGAHEWVWTFECGPHAPTQAAQAIRRMLTSRPTASLHPDAVATVVLEILTSATATGVGPLQLRASVTGRVWRFSATDDGARRPADLSKPEETLSMTARAALTGLAVHWGIDVQATGAKTVWFYLSE